MGLLRVQECPYWKPAEHLCLGDNSEEGYAENIENILDGEHLAPPRTNRIVPSQKKVLVHLFAALSLLCGRVKQTDDPIRVAN